MTCIVGIAHEGKVILGADSAGTGGWDQRIRRDRKVFKNGELIFGFTSSFRMGQLLEFALSPPPILEGQEPYAYAVKALVPAVRQCFKDGGWSSTKDGREEGGFFLVGFRGHLFTIQSDFQVAEDIDGFAAVGCGDAYAMGAMDVATKQWQAGATSWAITANSTDVMRGVLTAGLEAAAKFSAGVAGPFHFVELPRKE